MRAANYDTVLLSSLHLRVHSTLLIEVQITLCSARIRQLSSFPDKLQRSESQNRHNASSSFLQNSRPRVKNNLAGRRKLITHVIRRYLHKAEVVLTHRACRIRIGKDDVAAVACQVDVLTGIIAFEASIKAFPH